MEFPKGGTLLYCCFCRLNRYPWCNTWYTTCKTLWFLIFGNIPFKNTVISDIPWTEICNLFSCRMFDNQIFLNTIERLFARSLSYIQGKKKKLFFQHERAGKVEYAFGLSCCQVSGYLFCQRSRIWTLQWRISFPFAYMKWSRWLSKGLSTILLDPLNGIRPLASVPSPISRNGPMCTWNCRFRGVPPLSGPKKIYRLSLNVVKNGNHMVNQFLLSHDYKLGNSMSLEITWSKDFHWIII